MEEGRQTRAAFGIKLSGEEDVGPLTAPTADGGLKAGSQPPRHAGQVAAAGQPNPQPPQAAAIASDSRRTAHAPRPARGREAGGDNPRSGRRGGGVCGHVPSRMAGERAAGCAQGGGGAAPGGGGSALPPRPFICSFPGCDATFNKGWRLDAHLCRHTGEVSRAGP